MQAEDPPEATDHDKAMVALSRGATAAAVTEGLLVALAVGTIGAAWGTGRHNVSPCRCYTGFRLGAGRLRLRHTTITRYISSVEKVGRQ